MPEGLGLAWPWLALAAPLPLLAAWLLPPARDARGPALRVPFYAHALGWGDGRPAPAARARRLLSALAWIALLAAACRPQWVGDPLGLPVTGRDLMLAVDLSGSMRLEDLVSGASRGTRLAVVKRRAGAFIERRSGDRLGLVLFGSRAYVQAPLTFDRETVRALLRHAAIGDAGLGTAIGDAIGLAVKRLRARPSSARVLVLLTDGANTAGEVSPLEAAELAAAHGVRIYTIGVGSEQMVVHERRSVRRRNPSLELDRALLERIAALTGGRFFRARDDDELEHIYAELDRLEPVVQDTEWLRPREEIYHWPLAGALLLAAAAWLAPRLGETLTAHRGRSRS